LGFLGRLFRRERQAASSRAVPTALFGGRDSLDVVGESFYQESLRNLVGPTAERVHVAAEATLVPETDNQHDPNAVAVWIAGHQVGHLSREDAARFRPGLLALQRRTGSAIALPGVIAGGDGRPLLGVFLNYDAEAFGLPAAGPIGMRPAWSTGPSQVRTGLSEAVEADAEDDDYDLGWEDRIPSHRPQAIAFLREVLRTETEPVSRHFAYAQLEQLLYGARDDLPSALRDYDATCEAHHADMATIRPGLIKALGGLPLLETYKQAAIRHQKTHEWSAALRWAELGIAAYGGDALRPEFVDDLNTRVARYRAKCELSSS